MCLAVTCVFRVAYSIKCAFSLFAIKFPFCMCWNPILCRFVCAPVFLVVLNNAFRNPSFTTSKHEILHFLRKQPEVNTTFDSRSGCQKIYEYRTLLYVNNLIHFVCCVAFVYLNICYGNLTNRENSVHRWNTGSFLKFSGRPMMACFRSGGVAWLVSGRYRTVIRKTRTKPRQIKLNYLDGLIDI